MYIYIMCMSGTHKSQKSASDLLVVKLQIVLGPTFVLGTEPTTLGMEPRLSPTQPSLQLHDWLSRYKRAGDMAKSYNI